MAAGDIEVSVPADGGRPRVRSNNLSLRLFAGKAE
jgi:hypothetical protein